MTNKSNKNNREHEHRKSIPRLLKPKVLIVCGGEKTEKNYFDDLKRAFHLTAAFVIKASGLDPKKLVEHAIGILASDPDFDLAFVVFDRDSFHLPPNRFDSAIQLAGAYKNQENKKLKLQSIASGPCFEVWYLMHFLCTTKHFERKGRKSPADCVIDELKKHVKNYEKNISNPFSVMGGDDGLKKALQNCKKLEKQTQNRHHDTFSDMHHLINQIRPENNRLFVI